jgi:hypothetical protein
MSQYAEAQRGGGRFGGASLVRLVSLEEVQEELKLTDEQTKKAADLNEELRSDIREAFQAVRDAGGDFAESREKMRKLQQEASATFAEVLEERQQQRLREIFVQVNGASALSDKHVAKALKITDEQKKKLKQITADGFQTMRDAFQDLRDAPQEERRDKFAELREKGSVQLLAVLTKEQTDAFEKMKGEEIELDLSQLRRRN